MLATEPFEHNSFVPDDQKLVLRDKVMMVATILFVRPIQACFREEIIVILMSIKSIKPSNHLVELYIGMDIRNTLCSYMEM